MVTPPVSVRQCGAVYLSRYEQLHWDRQAYHSRNGPCLGSKAAQNKKRLALGGKGWAAAPRSADNIIPSNSRQLSPGRKSAWRLRSLRDSSYIASPTTTLSCLSAHLYFSSSPSPSPVPFRLFLHAQQPTEMASALRLGFASLRAPLASSVASPARSLAFNGARCYSSAKAKASGVTANLSSCQTDRSAVAEGYLCRQPAGRD